jgi:glycosyltransferase involved in cell wall biosynthesis
LTNFARTWNERHRLRNITTIVSSSFVRNQMLREGYDPDRLMYVPKPAPEPVERIAPPPPSPQFLFLGRIVPHKGLAWLLESLAALERPARLDIAGEGVEAEAMKALVARLHLQDRVVFHGWVNRSVTERLLDRATALVIPSRWHEPFGQVSLEAMARGRAVIASDTGALPEIILHRQTGLIVPAKAREALAAAMRQLADHPQCAAEMGLAGWHRVQEHYSMENHLNRILDLYRQCSAEAPALAV